MKQDKTLLKIVQKIQRKELIRYASNLGLELDETWNISKLRKAYTEFILSDSKKLLLMLPKADLDIIRKAKDGKAGEGIDRVNDHLTPIMVLYGLAEMELLEQDFVSIIIAEDLRQLLIPHIDWALEYDHNQQRMSVEIIVEGLANILGIVTQDEIRKYLKLLMQNDNDKEAVKAFEIIRQYSLLLDSMEYAGDLENAENEDIRFVSRYGWEDKRKMEQFIAQHSKKIDSMREFSLEELAKASGILFPFIPNPKTDEFMHFLTRQIGLSEASAHIVCFNLWYYKIHYGEYALDDMPMDRLAEEGMQRLADFANNLPLWYLRGFTAADYPTESFVPKLSTKEPLGPMLRKLKKEAYLMTDILNGKTSLPNYAESSTEENPWEGQKIGRNDPCPCGSGMKYKKCHGKSL